MPTSYDDTNWSLRPATAADVEPVAELKAVVMRPDLERLGRYDTHRVRQRLRDEFRPAYTTVIEVAGAFAGCVAFAPYGYGPGYYLEHFYLAPETQGRGLGTTILRTFLARADAESAPVRLVVVRGSAARRLYEREGFTVESEDPIDVRMVREPGAVGPAGPLTEREVRGRILDAYLADHKRRNGPVPDEIQEQARAVFDEIFAEAHAEDGERPAAG